MSVRMSGGCQCGAIRYEILDEPKTLYLCHCTQCQRQSSSAFGMSLTVARSSLRITGAPKSWTRDADSGKAVVCLFCGECGTRLFHDRPSAADVINVKAGTLDDTSWLAPVGHLWTKSAQAWVRPWIASNPGLIAYEG